MRRRNKIKLKQGQNKRRRRSTGETNSNSKRRNSFPDIDDTELSEITTMMSTVHVEPESNTSVMLEEIKKMEKWLSEKITSNKDKEIADLEERLNNNIRSTIDASIKDALKVMQTSICMAVQSHPVIRSHSDEIKSLKDKNLRLN